MWHDVVREYVISERLWGSVGVDPCPLSADSREAAFSLGAAGLGFV